jgi:riboflavin synthase
MFTGLIEATARVNRIDDGGTGRRIRISTPLGADLTAGDSVSVNGVCLTAAAVDAEGFIADVAPETLRVTTLGSMRVGQLVNLERPLRADGRLGGHFVLGHVDGVGRIAELRRDGESYWLEVECPQPLRRFLVHKGSIAIDGTSLTIASLHDDRFGVQLVPFTMSHTAFADAKAADAVNLEVDIIGKYVARLMTEAPDAVAGFVNVSRR